MRFVVPFLTLSLLLPAPPFPDQSSELFFFPGEHFMLFTGCKPIRFGWVTIQDDEEALGLEGERVEAAVRSRLRGARIYFSGPTPAEALREVRESEGDPFRQARTRSLLYRTPVLAVHVLVAGSAFSLRVAMMQQVSNANVEYDRFLSTWTSDITGTHRGDPSFVLGAISEAMDTFIDDYLRVNEEACDP